MIPQSIGWSGGGTTPITRLTCNPRDVSIELFSLVNKSKLLYRLTNQRSVINFAIDNILITLNTFSFITKVFSHKILSRSYILTLIWKEGIKPSVCIVVVVVVVASGNYQTKSELPHITD